MVCKQEPPGAKPPLTGLMKIQLLYVNNTVPANKAANVLHARWLSSTNHSTADLNAVAANAFNGWVAHPWQQQASTWFLYQCVVSSLGGDGLVGQFSGNTAGGSPQPSYPPQCAVCISWRAGLTARGGRARTYIPAVPQTATVSAGGSALTATYADALRSAAVLFLNNFDASTVGGDSAILGVPSYYNNCRLRPVPLFFNITDALVHERMDSQRRRSGKEAAYPIG